MDMGHIANRVAAAWAKPMAQLFPTNVLYAVRNRNAGDTTDDGQGNIITMDELEQSIRKYGFLNPLLVSVGKDSQLTLKEGNHRIVIAHERLGLPYVPAVCIIE